MMTCSGPFSRFLVAVLCITGTRTVVSSISLRTTSSLPNTSPQFLHQFLASPENWPKIVISSQSVRTKEQNVDLSKPLDVGREVEEVFGLPPVLPLSVTWTCKKSVSPQSIAKRSIITKEGSLEFVSSKGVPGIASDCRMAFQIQKDGKHGSEVELQIDYEPQSPLAYMAIPLLWLDNEIALKALLPYQVLTVPLDKFRRLMGSLYGIAGLAHAADCLLGSSQLLVAASGCTYGELSTFGQLYALIWCAAGPLAFALTNTPSQKAPSLADWGLILYGTVEVGGAWLLEHFVTSGDTTSVVSNAIAVQAIVALAWVYSSTRQDQDTEANVP
eukprot:scaffold173632_cov46-Attheya_sp.AAC.2